VNSARQGTSLFATVKKFHQHNDQQQLVQSSGPIQQAQTSSANNSLQFVVKAKKLLSGDEYKKFQDLLYTIKALTTAQIKSKEKLLEVFKSIISLFGQHEDRTGLLSDFVQFMQKSPQLQQQYHQMLATHLEAKGEKHENLQMEDQNSLLDSSPIETEKNRKRKREPDQADTLGEENERDFQTSFKVPKTETLVVSDPSIVATDKNQPALHSTGILSQIELSEHKE